MVVGLMIRWNDMDNSESPLTLLMEWMGNSGLGFEDRRALWTRALLVDESELVFRSDGEPRDGAQIRLDVARSFVHFKNLDPEQITGYREKLGIVLEELFLRNKHLHYYQGFNDVCSVVSLLFDTSTAILVSERIALYFLIDFMQTSISPLFMYLDMLHNLLESLDPELRAFLQNSQTLPYFCTSWIITWFSHDIGDLHQIYKIFDLILSTHLLLPVYLSVSLLVYHRHMILGVSQRDIENGELYRILKCLPNMLTDGVIDLCNKIFRFSTDPYAYPSIKCHGLIKYRLHKWITFQKYGTGLRRNLESIESRNILILGLIGLLALFWRYAG